MRVSAERTSRSGNRKYLARHEPQHVEGPLGGESVHRQSRGLHVAGAGGDGGNRAGGQHQILAVTAVGAVWDKNSHHVIAHGQPGVDAFADVDEEAGDIHSGYCSPPDWVLPFGPRPGSDRVSVGLTVAALNRIRT